MKNAWMIGLVMLPMCVRADVVHLANGQTVKGRVLTFWNSTFEVAAPSGEITKHPQATVKSIEFDGATGSLDTRMKGRVEGTITGYDNGAFAVQAADGHSEKYPATFVKEVSFNGGSSGGAAEGGSTRKIETITHGSKVDVAKALVHGQVTIVDFYADWCGPCRQISPTLEKIAKEDHDVVLRKVDIVKWGSPVALQYSINSIPHIEIYDRQAKLVGTVVGVSPDQVQQLVKQAKGTK